MQTSVNKISLMQSTYLSQSLSVCLSVHLSVSLRALVVVSCRVRIAVVGSNTPVLRIDNQQNFKIMKISILFKSFISLFYVIRYIL